MITRRKVLVGGAAAAGVVLVGGAVYVGAGGHYGSWIHEVLSRHLPGHGFDPDGLDLYVRQFMEGKRAEGAAKLELYALAEQVSDPAALLPGGLRQKLAEEERRIVTSFLMGSDFFSATPRPRVVTYFGSSACANPFARVGTPA